MLDDLNAFFSGDYALFRDRIVGPEDDRPGLPARALLTDDGLGTVLERFGATHPGADRRGLVSLWSRYYFLWLTVPSVVANLVLHRELPVALDDLDVILGDDGLPSAFRVPDEGRVWSEPPEPFERFSGLLAENVEPLIDGLYHQVKVSRRVLWSNAGNYFEWLVSAMVDYGAPEAVVAPALTIVEAPERPDGTPNPMHHPVQYVERSEGPSPLRQRRQCCIQYRVPGFGLCGNCPLIDRPPKGVTVG
ncbi:ferric iron reductase protein FhuF [Tamilnaduibacter salinus]|uniref:Ferric iron reductase protein FhuF n=2 Tax=Tamilnaduibacter salinus TaxID=1484056 RepID=A0A2U1D0K6_9GAMM|nr:ferric iron reductase protein FhuF [Tamilnaduibacter salinus]